MKHHAIRNMVLAALFLALGYVMPYLTGQIPQIGSMLLPMHIPVLLCGFICGPWWGLAVGAICPIFRSLIAQMPPMMTAIPMAFELAAYGCFSGLIHKLLNRTSMNRVANVIVSLLSAMVLGRVIWGVVRLAMTVTGDSTFPMSAFIAGAITNAIPGIILQVILVPVLVLVLEKNGVKQEASYAGGRK